MRPAKKHLKGKWIAGTAALTLIATVLSVGSAHGRLIEWASTEFIYTPAPVTEFSSDCLTPQGQTIQLKDWLASETSRTIAITISKPPEVTEPPVEEPTEAPTEETTEEPTQEPTEEPTQEPTEVPTEEPTQEPTEAPTEEPTEAPTEEPTEAMTENTQPQAQAEQENATAGESTTQTPDAEDPDAGDTNPEDPTEEGEIVPPTTEAPQTDPTVQWTNGEVTVTLDTVAAAHLSLSPEVTENQILVTLTRREGAPGLAETTQMSFQVQWQGLQGTFSFRMEPYGDVPPAEAVTDDAQREVVTGLTLFSACDVMDVENPISVLKLNQQTCEDFTLRFSCESEPVYRVRYSLDNGETYTMLYETNQLTISWPYPETWGGTVYLDFSQALTAQQRPTINVIGTLYTAQEYSPVRQSVPKPGNFVLQVEKLPYLVEMSPFWGSTQLEQMTLERLTVDEEGQLIYVADASLVATPENGGIRLTPATENTLPASGSYRLTILWSWYGAKMEEYTVYFFVNTH